MNKVILSGRTTDEPTVRYTQGSNPMPIATYTLAVDRKIKKDNEPSADFIKCIAFDKKAEFCEKYVKRGTKLLISGRIQTGSYTNRDGKKVYTTDIIVDEQEFAESKKTQDNSKQEETAQDNSKQKETATGFMNIPDDVADDYLPFN